jgi:hypothetical protein
MSPSTGTGLGTSPGGGPGTSPGTGGRPGPGTRTSPGTNGGTSPSPSRCRMPVARPAGVPGAGPEAGVSTIEVVLLAPVLIVFILFIVSLGLVVDAKGQAYGAARDAARAGALQRHYDAATQAAQAAAAADLGNQCQGGPVLVHSPPASFAAGELFVVEVRCNVSLRGLNLLGLGPSKLVVARAAAPLDTYRRTGPS